KRDKTSKTGRLLSTVPTGRLSVLAHLLLPLVLLSLLGGLFAADLHRPPQPPLTPVSVAAQPAANPDDLADPYPRLGVLFHDRPDALLPEPTMSFGLVLLKHKDPERPGRFKRLTFDELGRSNNTCLRVEGAEQLFGHTPGRWRTMAKPLGSDNQGRQRQGMRSIWEWPGPHIVVTQRVEIVAGEQTRLLDTCRVSYTILNEDDRPHNVGLRFLLDTFIGANDGVPFHIPGINRLIDTSKRFDEPAAVPAFIEALEHDRLDNPGTVAHLQLRLGKRLESPSRVTLGSWPDPALAQRPGGQKARGQLTGWDVPVLSMHALPQADSAVTLYWDERPLLPGDRRVVGFAYGLVGIASSEGKGELAATVGGSFRPGGQFIVSAYLSQPAPGQTVNLALPEGFSLVDGAAEQRVPPVPAGATRRQSAVVWTVQAPSQEGRYRLRVVSSDGVSQTIPVTVREWRLFD
ncbi:MAG TPA: hypothetical protein VFA18_01620, partial [Gemmataceae bacterium]|nr:hypothetical protein [Gemmataceae bacterium]